MLVGGGEVWDRLQSGCGFTGPFLEVLCIFISWGKKKNTDSSALHPRRCIHAWMAEFHRRLFIAVYEFHHYWQRHQVLLRGSFVPFLLCFLSIFPLLASSCILGDFCLRFTLSRRFPMAQTRHAAACWRGHFPFLFGINRECGLMAWNLKLLLSIRDDMATLPVKAERT